MPVEAPTAPSRRREATSPCHLLLTRAARGTRCTHGDGGAQEGPCSCTGGLGSVVAAGPAVERTELLLRPGCSCLAPQQLPPGKCSKQEQNTNGSGVPGTYLHKYLQYFHQFLTPACCGFGGFLLYTTNSSHWELLMFYPK